jgi:5'-nucleotidase / UDP-sugar diphosphatase
MEKVAMPNLKTKIDELKRKSAAQGIETLHLDGGDFGEGTSFFLVDEGRASLKALDLLGTEISVIGNHDHMMGGQVLADQIRGSKAKTKFISANLVATPNMNLQNLVTPFVDVEKAGIKIRVIGLSTAEAHFQYTLLPGFILPPIPVGLAHSSLARNSGRELVIALTHIGLNSDLRLARESSEIDLIVGGHSHTRLEQVRFQRNKKGRDIPIVQAGAHGLVVGELLIDVKEDGNVEVLSYQLHEIEKDLTSHQLMEKLVAEAVEKRNDYFNGRWDEVIGVSEIPLPGYALGKNTLQASCWGEHMARMTSMYTNSDIGIYLSAFAGQRVEPGPITYGDMIENFPHFRSYHDQGWEISTIRVNGKILKSLIRAMINVDNLFGINFYGVTYREISLPRMIPWLGGRKWATSLRSQGQSIQNKKHYTISFPTEVAFALRESLPKTTQRLFPSLQETGEFYWDITERYIRENSPLRCLPQSR